MFLSCIRCVHAFFSLLPVCPSSREVVLGQFSNTAGHFFVSSLCKQNAGSTYPWMQGRAKTKSSWLSLFSIHVSMYPCIHVSIHPSIHPSIHLTIFLSVYLYIELSICLYVYPSLYPSIYLSIYLYLPYVQVPINCPWLAASHRNGFTQIHWESNSWQAVSRFRHGQPHADACGELGGDMGIWEWLGISVKHGWDIPEVNGSFRDFSWETHPKLNGRKIWVRKTLARFKAEDLRFFPQQDSISSSIISILLVDSVNPSSGMICLSDLEPSELGPLAGPGSALDFF